MTNVDLRYTFDTRDRKSLRPVMPVQETDEKAIEYLSRYRSVVRIFREDRVIWERA